MELSDLHDYPLTDILEHLDHSSKLQMMATCKRFEQLIGQSKPLTQDMRLKLNGKILNSQRNVEFISNISRKFGEIQLEAFDFLNQPDHLVVLLELLEKIGKGVKSLKLFSVKISNNSFLEKIERVSNLESLNLNWITFEGENCAATEEQHCKKLQNLTIGRLESSEAVLNQVIPSTLSLLEMRINNLKIWTVDCHPLFTKQTKLRDLKLDFDVFHPKFEFSPLNSNIESLYLKNWVFDKDAIKNVVSFVKKQENLKKVMLRTVTHGAGGKEILREVLKLPNLKFISIEAGDFFSGDSWRYPGFQQFR
jgi:hypothetical protein